LGWLLRSATGGYSRTNSVWPARFDDGTDLDVAIDAAETYYRRRGLAPRFQVLSIARPGGWTRRLQIGATGLRRLA
jgi:hypothetical protein